MGRPVKKTKQEVNTKEDPFKLQRNTASKSKLKNVSFQQSKKGRFQKSIGNASKGMVFIYQACFSSYVEFERKTILKIY